MGKGTGDEVVGECAMAEGFCCVGEVVGVWEMWWKHSILVCLHNFENSKTDKFNIHGEINPGGGGVSETNLTELN